MFRVFWIWRRVLGLGLWDFALGLGFRVRDLA